MTQTHTNTLLRVRLPQELRWTSLCLRSWSGSVCLSWLNTSRTCPPCPLSPSLGSSPSSSACCPSTAPSAWSTVSSSMVSKPSSSWVWLRWRPTLHSSLPAPTTDRPWWFSQGTSVIQIFCFWYWLTASFEWNLNLSQQLYIGKERSLFHTFNNAKFNIYEWSVRGGFSILRAHEMTPLICALEFSGSGWKWGVVLCSVLSARCTGDEQQQRHWCSRCETHKHHRPHQPVLRGETHTHVIVLTLDVWFSPAFYGMILWFTDLLPSYMIRFRCQKFGDLSVRHIERLRCRHRIQVLQAHEDTAKENAVSRQRMYMWCCQTVWLWKLS